MALGGDARSTNPPRWPRHRAKGPRWQRRKQANPTGDAEASGRAVTKGFRLRSMKDASGRPHQKQSFRKDCEIKLYPFSATISRRPDRSIGSGFLEACPRTCGKRPGPSARAFCKAKAKAAAFAKATLLWSGCAAERWIMAAAVLMFIFTTLVLYLYFCKVQTTLLCELFGVFQLPTLSLLFFLTRHSMPKVPKCRYYTIHWVFGLWLFHKIFKFLKIHLLIQSVIKLQRCLVIFSPREFLGEMIPKMNGIFLFFNGWQTTTYHVILCDLFGMVKTWPFQWRIVTSK